MRLLNLLVRAATQRIEIVLYLFQKDHGALLYLLPYQHELRADIVSGAPRQNNRIVRTALAIPSQVYPQNSSLNRALLPLPRGLVHPL
jgi:hypothetical protein